MKLQKIKTLVFPKGFTLVELIVVITILAILGTIGFISIGGYSSRARDSARVGDVAQISKSLDLSVITAGDYPMPDNYFSVTYLGGVVWNQGTIGNNVLQAMRSSIAGGGLNKKPIDPLKNTEYVYSEIAEGKAYQIKVDYEGDIAQTAIDIELLNNSLIYSASAAPGNPTIAYIRGNYAGLTAKTTTGSTTYVLAIPSIITNSGATKIDANALSGTLLFHGKSLLGASTYNPNARANSGVVFSGTGGLPTNDASGQLTSIITSLKSAYSGTDIASNSNITNLLATTGTASIQTLGAVIVKDQLGGTAVSGGGGGGGTVTPSDWRTVDPNCNKPDITIGSQTWAGCNSTIGSLAQNYNNGACNNYNGTNIGGSACYGTTTKENWSGISTSANGYSAGIPGISDHIYGALYQWDQMNSASCLGTGIAGSNTSCPCKAGYHIPTQAEWDALEVALGCTGSEKLTGDATGWECLVSNTADTTNGLGWTSNNANSIRKKLGLSLSGYCSAGSCTYRGANALYWSASVYAPSPTSAWRRNLNYSYASVLRSGDAQTYAFSARCLKD